MNTKRLFTLALVPVVIAACAKAPQDDAGGAAAELQLESDAQIYSYGVGFQIGSQMAASPLDIDAVGLMAGMRDALDKLEPRVEHERLQEVAQRVQAEMMEKQQAEQGRIAAANAEAAASFLAENTKKEGVVTLGSGLQYRVMEKGEGKKPAGTDTVEVNYRGTLVDGTEFDSSYKRGESVTFPVGNVIPGWQEALQLMPVGSKWQLFIPPDLAYGSGGQGPIPPNAALIFEVELMNIVPQS